MKVQEGSFHLNGHIIGFRPQTQKLESPYKTLSSTLAVKWLTTWSITATYRYAKSLSGVRCQSIPWLPKFRGAFSVLYPVICTLTLPKVAAIKSFLVLVMLQNQTKLTLFSEEDFQQTLHLKQSREVTREWHVEGEAKARGSLFLRPSTLMGGECSFLCPIPALRPPPPKKKHLSYLFIYLFNF